jgi:hypothetical protein
MIGYLVRLVDGGLHLDLPSAKANSHRAMVSSYRCEVSDLWIEG